MKNKLAMVDFSYENQTDSMVVFKCIGANNFFLERVLFPKETFIAQVPEGSKLEIWGNVSYGPTLEKRMRVALFEEQEPLVA